MKLIKLLERNFSYFIMNSFAGNQEYVGSSGKGNNGKGKKNKAEQLKNIELSKDEKIAKIMEYVQGDKLVSLDDNEELKNDILQKIKAGELDDEQIETIYTELHKIAVIEDQTFTPEVMEKIETEAAKDKFDRIQITIRRIQHESYLDHIRELAEAENMMCEILEICDGVKDAKNNLEKSKKNFI